VRVAVAGATGVLGRPALPALLAAGHECLGIARRPQSEEWETAAIDVLDATAVTRTLEGWRPDAVLHLATAVPERINPRRLARGFEATNRLRREGTRNLIEAARATGAERFVGQSIAFAYEPAAGLADEDAPLMRDPSSQFAPAVAAIAELERLTLQAGGTVLRFGQLYGPGTAFAAEGSMGSAARRGMLPILTRRGVEATFSFLHPADAARALVTTLASPEPVPGIFNVVDDDPAPPAEWIPALAESLGGPAPRRVPSVLLRPLLGPYGIDFMTRARGASNARAKATLGWSPSIPSWREGFAEEWAMLGSNQRP
jgi:nucleoside-diphosphate-sugar epimerase